MLGRASSFLESLGQRASVENPIYPLTATRLVELLGGPATDSGEQVTPRRAFNVIAFYRAVQIVAGTCAGVPLLAIKRDAAKNPDDVTDRFPVLTDPHPEMTAFEWFEWLYASLDTHGNAFFQKRRFVDTNKQVDSETGLPVVRYLLPIRPELVRVGRASDGTKWFEVQATDAEGRVSGEKLGLTTRDIFHVPAFGYDGVVGLSPVDLARQGIGLALAAERYAAGVFGRGALMSGILQTDRRLPPGAADALRERFQEMAGGLGNAHKVAVLDQGAKFQPLMMSPEDAQLIQTREFGVIEIARLVGVPPHLLMETSAASNWGTGLEQQTRGFNRFSLAYRFARVAARFTKEILPRGITAMHDKTALEEADILTDYKAASIAIRDGWWSRAEQRRRKGLPVTDPSLEKFLDPSATKADAGAASEDGTAPPDAGGLKPAAQDGTVDK